jgi:hypothetical protein
MLILGGLIRQYNAKNAPKINSKVSGLKIKVNKGESRVKTWFAQTTITPHIKRKGSKNLSENKIKNKNT